MVFSAPEMTTVSKPNRKPARAAVSDHKKIRRVMGLLRASRYSSEDISVQKVVAKLSFGVGLPAEFNKIGQFGVARAQFLRADGEQLAPVGTDIERCQFCFNHRQQFTDCWPILFPGKVDGHARFFVA